MLFIAEQILNFSEHQHSTDEGEIEQNSVLTISLLGKKTTSHLKPIYYLGRERIVQVGPNQFSQTWALVGLSVKTQNGPQSDSPAGASLVNVQSDWNQV